MPTLYLSSSGINQRFTNGPYLGSIVDKSFSNTSGLTFGPLVNFEENFISGSNDGPDQPGFDPDAVNTLRPCNQYYNRIQEDSTLCPPGDCTLPTLTSAALSSSCTATYDFKYNINYNSGSNDAKFTKIEYSTTNDFTNKATSSINNESVSRPPINISNLNSPPSNGYTTVYFRAFNECSNGNTSSYSNVLTASCIAPPPPTYDPVFINIVNNSKNWINFTTYNDRMELGELLGHTVTSTLGLNDAKLDIHLSIIGGYNGGAPPTKIQTIINTPQTNYAQYKVEINTPDNFSNLILASIQPRIDSDEIYKVTTILPNNQTTTSPTINISGRGGLHNPISPSSIAPTKTLQTVFSSQGLPFPYNQQNVVGELVISLDRTKWVGYGVINIVISPLTTQYYEYNPSTTSTCVLSGTIITLADGSTTPIDNLRGGDKVLSPSILTLPYDNNFDLFNWAVNMLVLTEGTAVVTGNKRSQVSEVYSINNGTLTTTSTHQHLFKQNGTWNIKPTPYLMVGDYLSDRNGEEILIESIEILTGEFTVFDLDVEENDLYIANGILTHNIKAPIDRPAELQ